MARGHTGITRRGTAVWDGVIGDFISKGPSDPHELVITPTMDTLFLTRTPAPRRVIKRNGLQGDLVLTHPGWLLNFVAGGDTLETVAPDGMREMDRLAIAITPEAVQRLELGTGDHRIRLRSALAIQDPLQKQLVSAIIDEIEHPSSHSRLFAESLALALTISVVRGHSEQPLSLRGDGPTGLAPWQIRRVRDYLEQHLAEDVALAELAALVGLSQSHFSRAFRVSTGLPPHRFQTAMRIERAKELLLQSPLSLDGIAAACGFSDQSHLARAFRARVGTSPGAWRQERKS